MSTSYLVPYTIYFLRKMRNYDEIQMPKNITQKRESVRSVTFGTESDFSTLTYIMNK